MNRRALVAVIVAVIVLAVAAVSLLARGPAVAVYTVEIAGVITVDEPVAPGTGYAYTLEGRPGEVHVRHFVAGGVASVGDLLLAGSGPPTWGVGARPSGYDPDCWLLLADGRVDGDWIEVNVGNDSSNGGIESHLRIPKAPTFTGVTPSGDLRGMFVCIDHTGTAVSSD